MGLHQKMEALFSLDPDVAIVPECSERSLAVLKERRMSVLWFGSHPHKGLGVICARGWPLRELAQPEQKWIVPVQVDSPTPFTLIAVWACAAGKARKDRYIGQVHQAFTTHPEWFSEKPVVVAGDFNGNKIWDGKRKSGNHSDVVKLLDAHGLVSAYHQKFGESQGAETTPTFHLFRHEEKPYHIDYVFIPREWMPHLGSVEIGQYRQWAKLSDHCPVVVEICR